MVHTSSSTRSPPLGLYYIAVTLQGRHISGSPFAMQTFPAAARSVHSSAFGANLAKATAGRFTEFNILAKDTYGNAEHASAGGNFSVVLHGPATINAKVVDSLTGVYVASYTPKIAGSYTVSVDYNQLPIFGSPYTTVIVPGKAHAASSVVACVDSGMPPDDCPALVGIAGEVNRLTITARDSGQRLHYRRREGGGGPDASGSYASTTDPLMSKLRDETRGAGVKVTVLDLGDGAYAANYRVLPAGDYQLAISIDGQPIKGSPFSDKGGPWSDVRWQLDRGGRGQGSRYRRHPGGDYPQGGRLLRQHGRSLAATYGRRPSHPGVLPM